MSPPHRTAATASKLAQFRHQDGQSQAQDGGSPSSSSAARAADKSEILEVIAACHTSLTTWIEEVKIDISLLRQDMQQLRDRVQESSDQANRLITQLQQKQDDLKNRMRGNNLRFIGLPEGTEGNNLATFLEDLLITTYEREAFSQSFAVERVHRMPAKKPPQGAPPRVFIAKFLNYKDRDAILRLSRNKGNIPLHNHQIMDFPDFSAEVKRQRSQFTDIKRRLKVRRLRVRHLKYAMLFPVRLRVVGEDRVHFFEEPRAASDWLDWLNTA